MALGIGFTELLLLAMMTTGIGIPLGIPPAAEDPFLVQSAPDEGLYYSMWVASREPQGDSESQLEQLLAEPEIKQFVGNAISELEKFLLRSAAGDDSEQTSAMVDLGISLARQALKGPGMVFVKEFEIGETGPQVEAGFVLGMDEGQDFLEQINRVVQLVMEVKPAIEVIEGTTFYSVSFEGPQPPVRWGVVDSHLVIGVGKESIEGILARSRTPAPAWYDTARRQSGIPQLATIGYLNLAGLRPLLEQMGSAELLAAVMEFLGADNLEHVISVTGIDGDGLASVTRLEATGALHGLIHLVSQTSLTTEDLSVIPADATVAVALSLDTASVFDGVRDFLGTIDAAALENLDSGLELMKQEFDIDLRTELLGSLGTSWRFYSSPSHGNWLTGWAASIAVRDAGTLRQVNDKIRRMFIQLQQGQRYPVEIRSMEANGQQVNYLSIPGAPASPAWCITDKELVVGLFTQTVKSHLARDRSTDSLAQVPDVLSQLKDKQVVMLHYVDTAKIAEIAYPFAQVGLRALGQQLLEDGIDLKVHQFPAAEAILPHLKPQYGILTRTENALVYRSIKSIPLGGGSVTTMPITAALLLPAVQAARQAARQMASMNNMKQLGLGMLTWHNTYASLPAAYSVNQDDKKLLSWRVHILPFVEQEALYRQFRLDEPWDSEHNKKLIPRIPPLYQSPLSTPVAGKTNYRALVLPDKASAMAPPNKTRQPLAIGNSKIYMHGHRLADIADGTSQTILLVEVGDKLAIPWTQPDEMVLTEKTGIQGWGANTQKTFTTLFSDGSVRQLSKQVNLVHLKAMFTRSGGEPVPEEAFSP